MQQPEARLFLQICADPRVAQIHSGHLGCSHEGGVSLQAPFDLDSLGRPDGAAAKAGQENGTSELTNRSFTCTRSAATYRGERPARPTVGLEGLDHECGNPGHHPCPSAPDWLIIGGESGPGARPMDLEWVRDLLAQCHQESYVGDSPNAA